MLRSNDEHYLHALKDVQSDLQSIRSSGGIFVILGILGAVCILLGVAISAYAYLGHAALMALNPAWFAAGLLITSGPAIACVMAGLMARQSLRTQRSNAIVMRASQILLMPADSATRQIKTLAEAVQKETTRIDELVESSHASLAGLKEQLEAERLAVSKSTEQNAQSIQVVLGKLADERQALAELTSAVEAQAEAMSDAIPRQARLMAEAARAAQHEVAKNDDALEARLNSLDETAKRLSTGLEQLNEMTHEAEQNSNKLSNAIGGFESRLADAARLVDAAMRASDMASSVASETGDSLNAAVASALDGAREASDFIRQQSRDAVSEAMKAMSELKQAGQEAESAVAAAGIAARSQADDTEKRIDLMSQSMFEAATRATNAAEAGLERARLRIERASALLNGLQDEGVASMPVEDPRDSFTTPVPATTPAPEKSSWLRPRQDDEDASAQNAYDFDDPTEEQLKTDDAPDDTPAPTDTRTHYASDDDVDVDIDIEAQLKQAMMADDTGLTWKDLLAGLDTPAEERDEAARYILSEIEQTGITLGDKFSSRSVKKISSAARRGDRNRRRVVREHAGTDVQSLVFRLQDDVNFRNSSDRFLTVEEPDALRALSETEKSRSPASPRLTAYLLLDSAMSSL